jgi:hypothetical protein
VPEECEGVEGDVEMIPFMGIIMKNGVLFHNFCTREEYPNHHIFIRGVELSVDGDNVRWVKFRLDMNVERFRDIYDVRNWKVGMIDEPPWWYRRNQSFYENRIHDVFRNLILVYAKEHGITLPQIYERMERFPCEDVRVTVDIPEKMI